MARNLYSSPRWAMVVALWVLAVATCARAQPPEEPSPKEHVMMAPEQIRRGVTALELDLSQSLIRMVSRLAVDYLRSSQNLLEEHLQKQPPVNLNSPFSNHMMSELQMVDCKVTKIDVDKDLSGLFVDENQLMLQIVDGTISASAVAKMRTYRQEAAAAPEDSEPAWKATARRVAKALVGHDSVDEDSPESDAAQSDSGLNRVWDQVRHTWRWLVRGFRRVKDTVLRPLAVFSIAPGKHRAQLSIQIKVARFRTRLHVQPSADGLRLAFDPKPLLLIEDVSLASKGSTVAKALVSAYELALKKVMVPWIERDLVWRLGHQVQPMLAGILNDLLPLQQHGLEFQQPILGIRELVVSHSVNQVEIAREGVRVGVSIGMCGLEQIPCRGAIGSHAGRAVQTPQKQRLVRRASPDLTGYALKSRAELHEQALSMILSAIYHHVNAVQENLVLFDELQQTQPLRGYGFNRSVHYAVADAVLGDFSFDSQSFIEFDEGDLVVHLSNVAFNVSAGVAFEVTQAHVNESQFVKQVLRLPGSDAAAVPRGLLASSGQARVSGVFSRLGFRFGLAAMEDGSLQLAPSVKHHSTVVQLASLDTQLSHTNRLGGFLMMASRLVHAQINRAVEFNAAAGIRMALFETLNSMLSVSLATFSSGHVLDIEQIQQRYTVSVLVDRPPEVSDKRLVLPLAMRVTAA